MNYFKGKKVVVIGGAGLIGSYVTEQLTRTDAAEICVFDNFCRGTHDNLEQALQDPRVKIFEAGGDITQIDLLNSVLSGKDCVFHLAALWLLQCHEFPRSAFEVNVRGTYNVLEACRDQRITRLVYSSSASVYGDAVETPMTEEHPFNNRTFYGATKIAGEAMCRAFCARYGLPFVGLRYMNVYGPRQDYRGAYVSVIMKILDRLYLGLPPVLHGDGLQAYDFVYVEDVARANLCAMSATSSDAYYNVGTGVRTTLLELCNTILEVTGIKREIVFEPAPQTFVTSRVGSIVKAERELGFVADTQLSEGLSRLHTWWKQVNRQTQVQ